MTIQQSDLLTSRHVEVGVLRHGQNLVKLHVWVPSSDELVALEGKHGAEFVLAKLTRDDLGDALVRWRNATRSSAITPAPWGTGPFLSVPTPVVAVREDGKYEILENAPSVAAMLLISPSELCAPAGLVPARRR